MREQNKLLLQLIGNDFGMALQERSFIRMNELIYVIHEYADGDLYLMSWENSYDDLPITSLMNSTFTHIDKLISFEDAYTECKTTGKTFIDEFHISLIQPHLDGVFIKLKGMPGAVTLQVRWKELIPGASYER